MYVVSVNVIDWQNMALSTSSTSIPFRFPLMFPHRFVHSHTCCSLTAIPCHAMPSSFQRQTFEDVTRWLLDSNSTVWLWLVLTVRRISVSFYICWMQFHWRLLLLLLLLLFSSSSCFYSFLSFPSFLYLWIYLETKQQYITWWTLTIAYDIYISMSFGSVSVPEFKLRESVRWLLVLCCSRRYLLEFTIIPSIISNVLSVEFIDFVLLFFFFCFGIMYKFWFGFGFGFFLGHHTVLRVSFVMVSMNFWK